MRQRAVAITSPQPAPRAAGVLPLLLVGLCAQVAAHAQMRGIGAGFPGAGAGIGSMPGGGAVVLPPPPPPPFRLPPPLPLPPPPPPPFWPPAPTPVPTAPPLSAPATPLAAPAIAAPQAQPGSQAQGGEAQESGSAQDDTRSRRLERVRTLWGSVQGLAKQNRGDELLRTLDEIIALLEEDGGFADNLDQMRKLRETTRLSWVGTLSSQGRHDEALAMLREAPASADREETIAQVLYAAQRIEAAFAALDDLASFDPSRAARLRGFYLLRLGAVPLAVEQLQRVSGNADVDNVLRNLQRKGLDRFRREERAGWVVYEAEGGTQPARTLAYWFPEDGGKLDASHGVELSVRPAARKLDFRQVLHDLLHLHWPWVEKPREYELAVYAPGVRHIVAKWNWEPDADEITEAARRGRAAIEPLHQAEEYLHTGRREEALQIALEQARTPGWWLPPQPNYKAMTVAIEAAVEMDDRQRAQELADRLGEWHPMWAALELARAWDQALKPELARAAYEAAIEVALLRTEAYQQAADFEWTIARAATGSDRPPAFVRAQQAARRLQAVSASAGLWLRAQIAYELEGFALASALLRELNQAGDAPDAAQELQALLDTLGQSEFTQAGAVGLGSGLNLQAWRCRQPAPEDSALKHHSAEVLVTDGEGNLVETFALTSQGVPPGAPRQFMLDRINAYGPQQLRVYGERVPTIERILQGVAAL